MQKPIPTKIKSYFDLDDVFLTKALSLAIIKSNFRIAECFSEI